MTPFSITINVDAAGGITVKVNGGAAPAPPIDQGGAGDVSRCLTECEEDIVSILRASDGQGLTMPKILDEMQARGQIHGDSTVRRALARLVKVGILGSSRNRKGYCLLESSPGSEASP